jgi:hypothetical protein
MAQYSRWLIPKGNEFRPGSEKINSLVQRLRKEKWIVDAAGLKHCRFDASVPGATGGLAIRTIENTFGDDSRKKSMARVEAQPWGLSSEWLDAPEREELRLVWPVDVDDSGVLFYPLSMAPDAGGRARYALEIHLSSDYVYPVADDIGPIPTECPCGEELSFEWDDEEVVPAFESSSGIFTTCEACCRTFDPGAGTATLTRPFDRLESKVRGGAAYRFALQFKSDVFVENASLAFHRELVRAVEDEFGRDFFEFGSLS